MILPPNFLEVFGFVTQAIVLIALMNGLRLALKRTQFSAPARSQIGLSILVLVFAWYGLVTVLAMHDLFSRLANSKVSDPAACRLCARNPVSLVDSSIKRDGANCGRDAAVLACGCSGL